MNKKNIVIIGVAALVVVACAYVALRLRNRCTDIIGVTTLTDRNTVIMNSKTGAEFVSGEGQLAVGEGERIRVEYDLSGGEIDISFKERGEGSASYEDITPENVPDVLENLPTPEDMTGEGAFGQDGITGKGSLYFDAAPGSYNVHIALHDAVGKAVVTAKAG
ncbi:MAG: hypothetical protein IKN96_08210 [Oscillibacter sp.]|nr:hypothetical protein [Oscillibacter sp.]